MFAENAKALAALGQALEGLPETKIVLLSSIGAHRGARRRRHHEAPRYGGGLRQPPAVTSVRAGWFMENFAGMLPHIRETGVLPSMLAPLDRAVPMVATVDVGRAGGRLLRQDWSGQRVIELEGPRRYAPHDVAAAFAAALGRRRDGAGAAAVGVGFDLLVLGAYGPLRPGDGRDAGRLQHRLDQLREERGRHHPRRHAARSRADHRPDPSRIRGRGANSPGGVPMSRLKGQQVLVLGGSSGIGLATAQAAAATGRARHHRFALGRAPAGGACRLACGRPIRLARSARRRRGRGLLRRWPGLGPPRHLRRRDADGAGAGPAARGRLRRDGQ